MEAQLVPNVERRVAMSAHDRMHLPDSAAARLSESTRPVSRPLARPVARPAAQNRSAAHDHAPAEIAAEDIDFESSARLITPAEPAYFEAAIESPGPRLPQRPAVGVLSMPGRVAASAADEDHVSLAAPLSAEPSRYASHHWRDEAWERERERCLRSTDHRPEHPARRFSQA